MSPRWGVALPVVLLLFARPALTQTLRGEGYYKNYGYAYGPWQPTMWSVIEFRTRCDGEQVRGTGTGPIRWAVEYRNRSKEPLNFDYVILQTGANRAPSASGRTTIKAGKTLVKLATIPTTRCDDGVVTVINHIRLGADVDSVPYAKPDRIR